ncbi:3'-5' exonuclease [Runella sp.]|uniref:3'-5' exonuclease n=1 Tax=Runella sp. TaxID=1960881 RepID=UPI003015FADB
MQITTFFIDTETTGIQNDDEMLSIAIIDQDGNVLLDTYVTPTAKEEWPRAMQINGITPEFIFTGNFPTLEALTPVIAEILESNRVVMYGADFDSRFIADALTIANPVVEDCMTRFSEYMGIWDEKKGIWKRHKLTAAAEWVGYEWIHEPHGALADALATRAVWAFLDNQRKTVFI